MRGIIVHTVTVGEGLDRYHYDDAKASIVFMAKDILKKSGGMMAHVLAISDKAVNYIPIGMLPQCIWHDFVKTVVNEEQAHAYAFISSATNVMTNKDSIIIAFYSKTEVPEYFHIPVDFIAGNFFFGEEEHDTKGGETAIGNLFEEGELDGSNSNHGAR
jgi:hypothetical protein